MATYLITNQKQMFTPQGYSFCSVEKALKYLNALESVAFDSETKGFDPFTKEILTTQYGDGEKQFVVDHSTVDIQLFKPLLESKLILMQNAKFDLRFLYYHKIVPKKIYDTFLCERILTTGIDGARKALDFLVYKYCKQTMDKTVRGNIHREGLSTRVIKYAGDDVKYLHKIKRKQEEKLKELQLQRAAKLDNEYVKVLAYIEFCGVKLDKQKWQAKCDEDKKILAERKKVLDSYIMDHATEFPHLIDNQLSMFEAGINTRMNWNSPKQVIPFMQKLGIDTKVKDKETGKMKDSIDSKIVLAPQKDKHPIVPLYIKYSEAFKVVSTYGEDWFDYINPVTGRIHTNYTQIMNTGRLSSGQKGNKKKGISQKPNMQNVPSEDRTRFCFVAEKGHTFIVADYSGQEQVILANKSLEPNLLNFYREGHGDMHSYNAKLIFKKELGDVALEDVKATRPDLRGAAKAAGFAINYGGTGITIARNMNIPKEEGDAIYNAYFKAFPGLKTYFEQQKKQAIANGYVEFNQVSYRKCFIYGFEDFQALHKEIYGTPGFWDEYKLEKQRDSELFKNHYKPKVREYFMKRGAIERDSLNYPIQGTAADMTKLAGIYMFRHLEEHNLLFTVKMPNVVHDEIHLETPKGMHTRLSVELRNCMEKAGRNFCKTIEIKAEPCITPYWTH